jgi:transposase-like protein
MPWQGVCPMELRRKLVNALVAEEDSMTALCEEYGVSRKTGYKWLTRFRAEGPAGTGRALARPAGGALGSHPGAEPGDHRHAAAVSELRGQRNCAPSCCRRRRSTTGRR